MSWFAGCANNKVISNKIDCQVEFTLTSYRRAEFKEPFDKLRVTVKRCLINYSRLGCKSLSTSSGVQERHYENNTVTSTHRRATT